MVTAQVTVGILQHINVLYQQVVHLKLAQCYLSIMYLPHSLKTGGVGGGGGWNFPNSVNLLSSINNLLYSLLVISMLLVTI